MSADRPESLGQGPGQRQRYASMAEEAAAFEAELDAIVVRLKAQGDALAAAAFERLRSRLKHCQEWYGARHERLWRWAHAELNEEQKTHYFSIVANGTADWRETPTYAQQLNIMTWRAERAEAELARLRQQLAAGSVSSEKATELVPAPDYGSRQGGATK